MELDVKIIKTLEAIRTNTLLAAKNLLTLDDMVLLTGYSEHRLRMFMHRNEIPYYKPNGRKAFFDRKEIEDWLRRNRVTPVYENDEQAAINAYLKR